MEQLAADGGEKSNATTVRRSRRCIQTHDLRSRRGKNCDAAAAPPLQAGKYMYYTEYDEIEIGEWVGIWRCSACDH